MKRRAGLDEFVRDARAAAGAGRLVAFGGSGLRRKPMAAAEALRRAGVDGLHLLAHVGGPEVDLLVGAGLVRRVVFSYVGFEVLGVAPLFREARETGAIEAEEWSEFGILAGLRAGAERVPFHPVRGGTASGLGVTGPLRRVASPFPEAETCLAVPALRPAVGVIHCDAARADGAAYVSADPHADRLLGLACDRLYITCERIVDAGEEPGPALFLPADVAGVIEAPGGSGFTSCPPFRGIDLALAAAYLDRAEDDARRRRASRAAMAGGRQP